MSSSPHNGRLRFSSRGSQRGLSLLELLISLTVAALLMSGVMNVVGESLSTETAIRQKHSLVREARFLMQRMTTAVGRTNYLMLPLVENPSTTWSESVRDVLAVTLDPTLDRDGDGWADANNDKDFQDLDQDSVRDADEWERIDEDSASDMTEDGVSGIIGIDDDGDGSVDEDQKDDDDEDGTKDEEENGSDGDLDGDGSFGEDKHQQMVRDDKAGLAGVDDDGDGSVDEGNKNDDDEDGVKNEDWLDPVVYYLNGSNLIERVPAIDPVDGTDFIETTISTRISQFQVTRLPLAGESPLVLIELELTSSDGEVFGLSATMAQGSLL